MKTPLDEAREAEAMGQPLTPYQRFILSEAAASAVRQRLKARKVEKRKAARSARKQNRR